jgi:hypothetical protein
VGHHENKNLMSRLGADPTWTFFDVRFRGAMNPMTVFSGISVATTIATAAHADGRSVLFLKGVAASIAAHCPKLPLDKDLMRTTKRISGNPVGTRADYADGVKYIDTVLETGEENCESVCGIRPGTCFFIKEGPPPGWAPPPEGK